MENQNQNMPQSPQVGFPTPVQKTKKSLNPIFIIIPVFLLILGGLAYFVFKGSSTEEAVPSPTPASQELTSVVTPSPVPSPTPSTSPTAKETLSLRVLNGTGVPGEAGYLQGILKNMGYSKIDTANADTSDATSTTVVYSSSVTQSLVDEIVTKLKTIYKSVNSKAAAVKGAYDIEITTGPRTGAATTPTATPATPSQ